MPTRTAISAAFSASRTPRPGDAHRASQRRIRNAVPRTAVPRTAALRTMALLAVSGWLSLGVVSPARAADTAPPEPAREGTRTGAELVIRSLALLGVQYRFGGNSPDTGLDCSGLVRHVYQGALGLVLPRRSEEISRKGESVSLDQLRPGDLVFFNTLRRAFSHVGIYIGGNRFVHAPSRGGQVRVEHIDNRYWMSRFNGGRRIAASETPAYAYAGLRGTPLPDDSAAPGLEAAWSSVGKSGSVSAPVATPGADGATLSWGSPY